MDTGEDAQKAARDPDEDRYANQERIQLSSSSIAFATDAVTKALMPNVSPILPADLPVNAVTTP